MYNQISITPAVNGFIVHIPPVREDYGDDVGGMPYGALSEHAVRRVTRIQKDELAKDDVLEEIRERNSAGEKTSDPNKKISFDNMRDVNTFCFATFAEVISFLSQKFVQ